MTNYFPFYRDYWLFYLVIAAGAGYVVAHERRLRAIQKTVNEELLTEIRVLTEYVLRMKGAKDP